MGRERIILERGDTIRETVKKQDSEGIEESYLAIVDKIGTDGQGRDYLHLYYPVDQPDAPFMTHLDLSPGQKQGKRAVIFSEFTTEGGSLHHKLERVEPRNGIK